MIFKELKIVFAILFLILAADNNTQAAVDLKSCETILNSPPFFESAEIIKSCYKLGQCPINVYHLIENISKFPSIIDLNEIEVIYIYSRWTGDFKYRFGLTKFESKNSRMNKKEVWNFHVVMKAKGYIFDFEKTLNGRAIPVIEYFKDMFGASWVEQNGIKKYSELSRQFFSDDFDDPSPPMSSEQKLHIRAIPARDYLKEYSFDHTNIFNPNIKNYIYWVMDGSPFLDQTLEQFLNQ